MQNEQFIMFAGAPPRKHVKGDAITFGTSHTWTPIHNGKLVISCLGARVLSTAGGGGFLAVHLIKDPVDTWYLMDLNVSDTDPHGTGEPAEFDLIGDSTLGSTLNFDTSLIVYPGLYREGSDNS
jgi:hypothetical protein